MPNDGYKLFRERFDAVRPDWERRLQMYRDNYRQVIAREQAGPYNSRIATKYTHTQLMTHVAFTVYGLLPAKPWLACKIKDIPIKGGNLKDLEGAAANEYERRLEEARFYDKLTMWVRTAAMYAPGVVSMTWDGVSNKINLALVNPANIAWDPLCQGIRADAAWIIVVHDRLNVGILKARAGMGMYRPKAVREVIKNAGGDSSEASEINEVRTEEQEPIPQGDDARIVLHEMITPHRIVTIHEDSQTVLRDIENPYGYIFYYDMNPYPEAFQTQGYSVPELLEGIQREKNTIRQQRTDIRSLEANPMMTVRRSSGLNINSMTSRPGKIIPIREDGDVSLVQYRDSGAPLVQEEMVLENEGDRLAGIMAHTRGERGAEMKATVANMLQTNINLRFAHASKYIQSYPLAQFLEDFVALCDQHETPSAIRQEEWQPVRQAARYGALKVRFRSEVHVGNPFAKIQVLAQMLQAVQGALLPPGQGLLLKQMLRLAEVEDYEDIVKYMAPAMQGGAPESGQRSDQGQGVAMTGEMARARAAGQPAMSMVRSAT